VTAIIALLVALAAWLLVPPSPDSRLNRVLGNRTRGPVEGSADAPGSPDARAPSWLMPVCAVTFGVGIAIVLGSIIGLALGIAGAIVIPRLLARLESKESRQLRIAITRQQPDAADLLAATLASGAPPAWAVTAVASAMDEPMRGMLRTVAAGLDLGASSHEAWTLADPGQLLESISAAFIRSESSGAPLSDVLAGAAQDLRRQHRLHIEVAARAAGVHAVAPLGACFLPAFMLIGAVPIIASLAQGLFSS
jgi:Flp pilus assembly protein TadB